MSTLLDRLLGLHGTVVYLLVGLVVFAEDALFVGFVIPGETAAVLGGVAASRHNVSVTLMCLAVVLAAVIGDSVGYAIGDRYGSRLLRLRVLRRRQERIDAARSSLSRRGGPAVFFGRFVAFFRAVMPFLAGLVHMRYRKFLLFNMVGGVVWGLGSVLLGYLAGNSYARIEHAFGRVSAVIAVVVVLAVVIAWRIRGHRHR